jgi:hypothetical protein
LRVAQVHRGTDFLLETGSQASHLGEQLAHFAGSIRQLVGSEEQQRKKQDQEDLSTSDVEHGQIVPVSTLDPFSVVEVCVRRRVGAGL